ncbi:MAG: ABC transporter ATP-binding protein, partial [Nevskiales bacterium]
MGTGTRAHITRLAIALGLLVLPFLVGGMGNAWVRILDFALLYVMLALGLNIVVGFAGLLDLGYIAFYAVGAYLYALLASPQFGMHWPAWAILPLCALGAGLFGVLLGAPTLRLRGDYLAIVTLGFGEIIRIFMNNLNEPINFTNGPQGINLIDPIKVFGVNLAGDAGSRANVIVGGFSMPSVNAYYFLFLVLCIAIVFI